MSTDPEITALRREVRRLKAFGGGLALLLMTVVVVGFLARGRERFAEIDVERINVVDPDGRLALAIAHAGRLPGPMMDGKQYPQEVSGGRTAAAGMIFFNAQGDEVGGLIYHGTPTEDGGYRAVGHLSFDQWKQDQVVALQYQDDGERRRAGLNIWDRSTTVDIGQLLDLSVARRTASTEAEREAAERAIAALAADGPLSAHRIFLGSANRTATLDLRDTAGRIRLRMYVDSTDVARIEFLDESGRVVDALPR